MNNKMIHPKEFMSRWKEGIKNLTPAQQLHSQLVGYIGASVGLSLALVVLIYRTIKNFNLMQLGFAIFLTFLVYLQIISAIGANQKHKAVLEFESNKEKLLKGMEDDKNV